jgi:hypothetical protein
VPAGQQKVTFAVGTNAVNSRVFPSIQAYRQTELAIPGNPSAGLTLVPPGPVKILLPSRIQAKQRFTGTIVLNGPAGSKGVDVVLAPPVILEDVPGSVVVPAGETQATFEGRAGELPCGSPCERHAQILGDANGYRPVGNTVVFQ